MKHLLGSDDLTCRVKFSPRLRQELGKYKERIDQMTSKEKVSLQRGGRSQQNNKTKNKKQNKKEIPEKEPSPNRVNLPGQEGIGDVARSFPKTWAWSVWNPV